jgi:hypothetical protein
MNISLKHSSFCMSGTGSVTDYNSLKEKNITVSNIKYKNVYSHIEYFGK